MRTMRPRERADVVSDFLQQVNCWKLYSIHEDCILMMCIINLSVLWVGRVAGGETESQLGTLALLV